jgi:predicted nucleic acid-binding protein
MLQARLGMPASRVFLSDLAAGAFRVECLEPEEYTLVLALDQRYADLRLGLADLSIIVLARRFNTRRILTFDRRHFGAVEPLQGGAFELLPDMPGSSTAP